MSQARSRPRERLIKAAMKLTYREGVSVGIDAILREAQVARRSLYQHFVGKDELLAAALRRGGERDLAGYEAALKAGGDDPAHRVRSLFAGLATIGQQPTFRGCRFINAELSIADSSHPAHEVVAEHKAALRHLLRDELERLDHPDAERGSDQLLMLVDAALVEAAMRPTSSAASLCEPFVESVIAAQA